MSRRLDHDTGSRVLTTESQLEEALRLHFTQDTAELWLSGEARFPCLAILVRGEHANVHWFPEEGHPGFQSVSEASDVDGETTVTFRAGGQETQVSRHWIVSADLARRAAREMFHSTDRPECLVWEEL